MSVISELALKHARDSEANEGCELGTMVGDFEAFGRDLLEKCCAAECRLCAEGIPVVRLRAGYLHEASEGYRESCDAARLRALGE